MKWTTIEYIKEHSRLDYDCEVASLELYADAAEETIMKMCGRTYEDFITNYGCIPTPIRQATLMLVELSFMQRSPVSMQSLYVVPYGLEFLIKPYMRLAQSETSAVTTEINTIVLGSDFMLTLPVSIDDDVTLSELTFSVEVINNDQKDKKVTIASDSCTVDDDENTISVILDSESLGIGLLMAKITLQIPDEQYPGGVCRQAQKVNPYTRIVG